MFENIFKPHGQDQENQVKSLDQIYNASSFLNLELIGKILINDINTFQDHPDRVVFIQHMVRGIIPDPERNGVFNIGIRPQYVKLFELLDHYEQDLQFANVEKLNLRIQKTPVMYPPYSLPRGYFQLAGNMPNMGISPLIITAYVRKMD